MELFDFVLDDEQVHQVCQVIFLVLMVQDLLFGNQCSVSCASDSDWVDEAPHGTRSFIETVDSRPFTNLM